MSDEARLLLVMTSGFAVFMWALWWALSQWWNLCCVSMKRVDFDRDRRWKAVVVRGRRGTKEHIYYNDGGSFWRSSTGPMGTMVDAFLCGVCDRKKAGQYDKTDETA